MKGVSWITGHVIGDGGVLIIQVLFDTRAVRVTCPAKPERVLYAIQQLTKFVREERAKAKRAEYSRLH